MSRITETDFDDRLEALAEGIVERIKEANKELIASIKLSKQSRKEELGNKIEELEAEIEALKEQLD